ncbi:MAG TPA: sugar phosphate isomerase/epimerase family protein [Planctomycetaceae bacterium]|nr:sugar phosphate isomerase/epimerase family protein [Planctomycetaceae bacterium]
MILGYNTNGLAHHRWHDALDLLAETGYRSVAITVDHDCLDPWGPHFDRELDQMRDALERLALRSVIETGARYLLDPRVKHEPTLVTADPQGRRRRIDFLQRCIDIAAALGSDAVSFWSGAVRDGASPDAALDRLVDGCRAVIDDAGERNVRLAFEPEPGMLIATMAEFAELRERIAAPHLGLTIDIGHLQCVEDLEAEPITAHLRRWHDLLFNVHIEDMRRGVHEHLRFGEGEIDFRPVVETLLDVGYSGGVHVELSRHSHVAPDVARESYAFLRSLLDAASAPGPA